MSTLVLFDSEFRTKKEELAFNRKKDALFDALLMPSEGIKISMISLKSTHAHDVCVSLSSLLDPTCPSESVTKILEQKNDLGLIQCPADDAVVSSTGALCVQNVQFHIEPQEHTVRH